MCNYFHKRNLLSSLRDPEIYQKKNLPSRLENLLNGKSVSIGTLYECLLV